MDATCTIQDSIHVFNLVHKYVSRILGTYHSDVAGFCNHLPKYVLFFVLLLLCGCLCIVIIKEAIIKVIIVIIEII